MITIFSQYGEVVNVEIIRDSKTGKSKGFGFLAYEDQRSTVLAVDNLNGAKILGRVIRVDHVSDYQNRRRERDDFNEEEEHARMQKILPKRLQFGPWSSSQDSTNLAEDKNSEGAEEDPMKDYLDRKSRRRAHHHKRHKKRTRSGDHHSHGSKNRKNPRVYSRD